MQGAEHMRDNRWVVRPAGALGTCGWINGIPWSAIFVNASNASQALRKAERKRKE